MPLAFGSSRKIISENIHELTHRGSRPRSHAQIVAIALSEADKSRRQHHALGGPIMGKQLAGLGGANIKAPYFGHNQVTASLAHPMAPKPIASPHMHLADGGFQLNNYPSWSQRMEANELAQDAYHPAGLFQGSGAGRTDRLPRAVAADSFVMPADVVSGLGEGNTLAGAKIMDSIMGSALGPYGSPLPRSQSVRPFADGGKTSDGVSHVMVAPGEYLSHKIALQNIGFRRRNQHGYHPQDPKRDLAEGHKWAREFVDKVRHHVKKFLNNAPKPKA